MGRSVSNGDTGTWWTTDCLCNSHRVNIRLEFEERSCCRPALTAAAACKDTEAERLGVGEVEPSGCRDEADSLTLLLVWGDIAEADEECSDVVVLGEREGAQRGTIEAREF